MIKIAFFDIDGTLLNWQGHLSVTTKQAIGRLQRNGIVPVIASARPPYNIYHLMQELGMSSYVAFNGGLVVHEDDVVYQSEIQKDIVSYLEKSVSHRGDSIILSTRTGFQIRSDNQQYILDTYLRKWDITKHCSGDCEGGIVQLEVFCSDAFIQEYTDGKGLSFYPWGSRTDAFNVVNSGVSKASGIQKLLYSLGLDQSESVAFGDGVNDIEMIRSVGIGVAMGNAVEELKHRANFVTRDVDEDGIAFGLKELRLI